MREGSMNIAFCGLDCSQCEAYRATLINDSKTLEKLAIRWGEHDNNAYKPEDIECGGCDSHQLNTYCNNCEVRACGLLHGLKTCGECNYYPCDIIHSEWASWKDADWTKAKTTLDDISTNTKNN